MYKHIFFSFLLLAQHAQAMKTSVQFLINDPQVEGYQYRGFQLGVHNVDDTGKDLWYAKIRFADKDDSICSGKTPSSSVSRFLGGSVGLGVTALILRTSETQTPQSAALAIGGGLLSGALTAIACTKVHESVGYWDSKVVMNYNTFSEDDHIPLESDDSFKIKKDDKISNGYFYKENLLFQWDISTSISLLELVGKIKHMRLSNATGPFPHYTLSGIGSVSDAMSCVSFCVRLGDSLGVPFSANHPLYSYISYKNVPHFPIAKRYSATPERVAKSILTDENLTSVTLGFRVRKENPWWILSELEAHVKDYPQVQEKQNV